MTGLADAFLRDILENPADDTPRLVFADWLEDNGELLRAEFIRLQINMARQHALSGGLFIETDEYRVLERREQELLCLPMEPQTAAFAWSQPIHSLGFALGRPWPETFTFRRGFVEEIALPLARFMDHAAVLFSAHPITTVRLTDRLPFSSHFHPGLFCWLPSSSSQHDQTDHVGMGSLPGAIYDRLPGQPLPGEKLIYWDTIDEANAALSVACVACGRTLADLPTLPPC